jgi:UDP-N-acetyl-D-glucosamine dehydrogenase
MEESKNLLTQEIYKIPKRLDDSDAIERFINAHNGKKIVLVQGLGFVGAVMSLVCANAIGEEYAVIGIDLPNSANYWKIKSINDGVFPLVADDPKIQSFFQNAQNKGNFLATYDPIAYRYADVIIVDINLDVQKKSSQDFSLNEFDVNLNGFRSAIETIGSNCSESALILVETTVPPGTCEKLVKPIIDAELKKRDLSADKYKLGHSYERVMPGPEYVNSIVEFPRVYSGIRDADADAVEGFLKTIINTSVCNLTRLENTTATEMAKVLENSYRAANIAFVVEWSRYAENAGVNLFGIINAIRDRKTHSNLMYPGIGVGGYCLTKDPLLASWSYKNFFESKLDLKVSIDSVSTNDQMPVYAFNRLVEVFGDLNLRKVTFLGISYRGDVGDTRFSPVETIVELAEKSGAIINLHDPYVSYWIERGCNVKTDLSVVLQDTPDIIIISTGHEVYKKEATIKRLMSCPSCLIFDTIGLFSSDQLQVLKSKHKVSVLGRGDIF